jgi:hypothetical protein
VRHCQPDSYHPCWSCCAGCKLLASAAAVYLTQSLCTYLSLRITHNAAQLRPCTSNATTASCTKHTTLKPNPYLLRLHSARQPHKNLNMAQVLAPLKPRGGQAKASRHLDLLPGPVAAADCKGLQYIQYNACAYAWVCTPPTMQHCSVHAQAPPKTASVKNQSLTPTCLGCTVPGSRTNTSTWLRFWRHLNRVAAKPRPAGTWTSCQALSLLLTARAAASSCCCCCWVAVVAVVAVSYVGAASGEVRVADVSEENAITQHRHICQILGAFQPYKLYSNLKPGKAL